MTFGKSSWIILRLSWPSWVDSNRFSQDLVNFTFWSSLVETVSSACSQFQAYSDSFSKSVAPDGVLRICICTLGRAANQLMEEGFFKLFQGSVWDSSHEHEPGRFRHLIVWLANDEDSTHYRRTRRSASAGHPTVLLWYILALANIESGVLREGGGRVSASINFFVESSDCPYFRSSLYLYVGILIKRRSPKPKNMRRDWEVKRLLIFKSFFSRL